MKTYAKLTFQTNNSNKNIYKLVFTYFDRLSCDRSTLSGHQNKYEETEDRQLTKASSINYPAESQEPTSAAAKKTSLLQFLLRQVTHQFSPLTIY